MLPTKSKTEQTNQSFSYHIYFVQDSPVKRWVFCIKSCMKKFILLFIASVLWYSCKEKTVQLSESVSFKKQKNVAYGTNFEQKMDLYIPKGNRNKDVFILIHGGGWRGGDKKEITLFTLSMMEKFPNSIFANINYRLASALNYGLPNQAYDIGSVIKYIDANYGGKHNYILLGNSAGGHLAMFYGYKFNKSLNVKAVVNIVGPSDLSDPGFRNYSDYEFVEKNLIDPRSLTGKMTKTHFGSPVNYINPNTPPTISFYGTSDKVIPSSQKTILDSALNKNNVRNISYEFNGGHLDWSQQPHRDFIINRIEEFLEK